jgi:hypothetical protein
VTEPAATIAPAAPAAATGAGLVGFVGTITYADGRPPERFEGGPALLADWELYALRNGYPHRGDDVPAVLMSLFVAFAATEGADGRGGFEAWRRKVYGVELETVDLPPTRPEASAA